ncbi:AN1-type zinc finger protein 4-like [Rhopilema esculentum]|uniref:AN1-type zinc finger protein 4-like n=1 Tax=Rhopilema esculentum TaxID=499914 RepID=UPI0031DA35A2
MDLYIETLTGTAFELRVSPFDTIMSIKAKIQRLEGIPVSQQHLIWQSTELDDELCLHDFDITDGATLKLVLAMRGGPINTRRISVEEPSLEEMAEYMEANRNEILDKLMKDNRQVTLLVFRDGDQLNFFRVYDRGDGTLTPLSETLSAASIYNLYDEEDDESQQISKEKKEENELTRKKMKFLQAQMANLNIRKQPKIVPRPPSSGRPNSNLARRRLRFAASHAENNDNNALTVEQKRLKKHRHKLKQRQEDTSASNSHDKIPLPPVTSRNRSNDHVDISDIISASNLDTKLIKDLNSVSMKSAEAERNMALHHGYKSTSKRSPRRVKSLKPLDLRGESGDTNIGFEKSYDDEETPTKIDDRNDSALSWENMLSNTSLESRTHRKSQKLKSLGEKKLLSRQESTDTGRRLLRRSRLASMEESIVGLKREATAKSLKEALSPSRLPQMESVSKAPPQLVPSGRKRTRCFQCAKKLGLATNYQCRCGNIYCATHRYAEAHCCTYDYKGEGRKVLEQSNPVVTAPKLPKI